MFTSRQQVETHGLNASSGTIAYAALSAWLQLRSALPRDATSPSAVRSTGDASNTWMEIDGGTCPAAAAAVAALSRCSPPLAVHGAARL
ncbi:hypothetical protein LDENG_00253140 [Lucifuga dentata]|nr:hypothetical protein LDENG_00253140 [Lucifuga dentata]